jgi:hypothetical protein
MHYHTLLNSPWTLEFERDGTEDLAIIRGADGSIIATSSEFWLPEDRDLTPPTLAGMQLMALAPQLLTAAEAALGAVTLMDEMVGPGSHKEPTEGCPLQQLDAVIKKITSLIE